jgi:hypothetical protein
MKSTRLTLSAIVALAAMLSASPAVAQGKGNDKHHERQDDDRGKRRDRRDGDARRDDRRDNDRAQSTFERRGVPRGWCQGRGNPHNTARNCGYRGSMEGIYRDRDGTLRDRIGRVIMGDGRVYDQRRGTYSRTSGTYDRSGSTGGSYQAAHSDYHRWHDQQCSERARNTSVANRLRVAAQCKAEHDQWHSQQGIRH